MRDGADPTTSLIQPSPLDEFGLAVNEDVKVLICTICHIGIPPGDWKGHLEHKHWAAVQQVRKTSPEYYEELPVAITHLGLRDPLEARQRHAGLAPVEGIKVKTGYYCPVQVGGSPCHKVTGTPGSFTAHLSSDHKGASGKPVPADREKYACDYQTIFDGKHRRYFRVFTGLSQAPTTGPYRAFLQQFKSSAHHAAQADAVSKTHELSSLLRVTKWDVFVGPFRKSPADVVGLAAFPSFRGSQAQGLERVLCLLHDVTTAWSKKVHGFWTNSVPSTLRLLGTA